MPGMDRRSFLTAAALPLASAWSLPAAPPSVVRLVKPPALAAGDTVALVAPATATFESVDLAIARESLEALGLVVRTGGHLLSRHGYLAGRDVDRAADLNGFFRDDTVRAILPIRGGWGSSRLLPLLDYDAVRRHPKIVLGFSDITSLLLGIHARTGLVTFHGPNGLGRWDRFSVAWVRRVLFEGQAVTMANLQDRGDFLAPTTHRVQTITPGTARGPMLGGNLTVLSAIIGSPYLPHWDGAILFLEDVREDIYRIDRMLTTLKLAGVLERLSGFVFGTCDECTPGDGYASLTLEEVLIDHIRPLGIPAYFGAMIGHGHPQFTIAQGVPAEIDAAAGTIRMLEPGVSGGR